MQYLTNIATNKPLIKPHELYSNERYVPAAISCPMLDCIGHKRSSCFHNFEHSNNQQAINNSYVF